MIWMLLVHSYVTHEYIMNTMDMIERALQYREQI